MSIPGKLNCEAPSTVAASNAPHILSYATTRTVASDPILSIWKGPTSDANNKAFEVTKDKEVTVGIWKGTAVDAEWGGTGVDGSAAANGTLLIGDGTGYTLATLTAGSNVTITNGAGSIEIASSAATSMADGNAAAPSWYFAADTNTGLFRVGADVLGISTGGVERARFGATNLIGTTLSTGATANSLCLPNNTGIWCSNAAGTASKRALLYANDDQMFLGMNDTHTLHCLKLHTASTLAAPETGMTLIFHNGVTVVERQVLAYNVDTAGAGYRALRIAN